MTPETSQTAAETPSYHERPSGRPIPTDHTALLTTAEAAYLLGLSVRTLETLRLRGGGPTFIALRTRAVRYQRDDLNAWIASRRRTSTSDTGSEAT